MRSCWSWRRSLSIMLGFPCRSLLALVIAIAGAFQYTCLANQTKEVPTMAEAEKTKNLCAQIPESLHTQVR